MLILTRSVGQAINIGEDVVVKVLGMRGGQISLGIAAPKDVIVHRDEIYDLIKRKQELGIVDEFYKKGVVNE